MELFLKGLLLGFAIAAPVGPIGILCIRRTLAAGMPAGFASGLGAATADGMYGAVAALGLTAVSTFLYDQAMWLRLAAGLSLLYLGARTFMSRPTPGDLASAKPAAGLAAAYGSTLFLTITNPATIISFSVAFAALGLVGRDSAGTPGPVMVLGVFLGSTCWWLLLSGTVGLLRARVNIWMLTWVNRTSGVLLAGFGVFALGSLAV